MELADFLNYQKISLDDVVEQAKASLHLTAGDMLFVCGSLVEGLGNEKSDLDLILITARQDIPFTSLHDVALIVGQCVIDVRVVQRFEIDDLLKRFNLWSEHSRQLRLARQFNIADRKLLHRLRNGWALYGADDLGQLQNQLRPIDLARHKMDWECYLSSTILVDLAGLRSAGDYYSMPFAAQEALTHAVDALLAGYGYSNPSPQWRVRLLANLPSEWELDLPGRQTGLSARELFLSLHRVPQSITPSAVLDHALRITAFLRRLLPLIECRLLNPSLLRVLPAQLGRAGNDRPLPHLDLDVTVRYNDGYFELLRLNERGQIFTLSLTEYSLLCLFDGETSRQDAVSYAERLLGNGSGSDLVEEMIALVRYGEFEARNFVDEQALNAILRRP
jgi:hypothetical protein